MNEPGSAFRPRVGDGVEVTEHRVGGTPRVGEILEVSGEPGREHFRVRWEDGSETILYPSSDTSIRPRRRTAKTTN